MRARAHVSSLTGLWSQFSTLDTTSINLFAILNGDEIADSFNDVFVCQVCASVRVRVRVRRTADA